MKNISVIEEWEIFTRNLVPGSILYVCNSESRTTTFHQWRGLAVAKMDFPPDSLEYRLICEDRNYLPVGTAIMVIENNWVARTLVMFGDGHICHLEMGATYVIEQLSTIPPEIHDES